MKNSIGTVAALLGLALAATACGGTSRLEELEGQMQDVFVTEQIDLEEIECGEPTIEPGAVFTCTASVVGGEGRLRVGVRIDNESRALFERENVVVDLNRVEADVQADLTDGLGFEVVVACGEGVLVQEVGGTFRCTVAAAGAPDGETRDVEITVDDMSATTQWDLL